MRLDLGEGIDGFRILGGESEEQSRARREMLAMEYVTATWSIQTGSITSSYFC